MGRLGATYADEPVKTQKQGNAFFRVILDSYDARCLIDSAADHAWLEWLVLGCPTTARLCPTGVAHFLVHTNRDLGYGDEERGFSLVAKGGSYPIPFSYRKALSGLPKTQEARVSAAMRLAVQPQTEGWKKLYFREGLLCPVLGDPLVWGENLDLDYTPDFAVLVQKFFRSHGVDDSCVTCDGAGALEDPALTEAWRRYHSENASLRFISIAGVFEKQRLQRVQYNANPFKGMHS